MEMTFQKTDGALTVAPVGRLDSMTASDFESRVLEEIKDKPSTLTVDFSEVDFLSSKGLRVLVTIYRALGGNEMILANANGSILEVLRLSGLMKFFTIQ